MPAAIHATPCEWFRTSDADPLSDTPLRDPHPTHTTQGGKKEGECDFPCRSSRGVFVPIEPYPSTQPATEEVATAENENGRDNASKSLLPL